MEERMKTLRERKHAGALAREVLNTSRQTIDLKICEELCVIVQIHLADGEASTTDSENTICLLHIVQLWDRDGGTKIITTKEQKVVLHVTTGTLLF